MKLVIVLGAAMAMSACVPARGTGEAFMSDTAVESKDDAACLSFGAQKGTQVYVDCRLRLRSERNSDDRARRFRNVLQ
jgi:hypothetical protein